MGEAQLLNFLKTISSCISTKNSDKIEQVPSALDGIPVL